ncbi:hypothetical protein J5Y09_20255 [Roseomonas sp. PWR1]|uniref:Uncharacterized protein n=1 Tax=Roseomonas nitratireducens TaxID=2820810 RepID=A0ABS4AZT5_9PROT|nr:hypothetical protein [Neoroseomonas nitratireducens]MBP0466271.1 hypothetical protein [Neoroseomonas nitratireducens]
MVDPSAPHPELATVLARFPADARLIRQLFLADRAFRGACEDYRLAQDGLTSFERLSIATPRHEVEEYRPLVRELEAEILAMFAAGCGASHLATLQRPGG